MEVYENSRSATGARSARCAIRSGRCRATSRRRARRSAARSPRRRPIMRNPAFSCSARLAVFSGKMLDWIVQYPASSAAAMNARSSVTADASPVGGGGDVDGVLDHAAVGGARSRPAMRPPIRRPRHPRQSRRGVASAHLAGVERLPGRGLRFEGRVAGVDALAVDRLHRRPVVRRASARIVVTSSSRRSAGPADVEHTPGRGQDEFDLGRRTRMSPASHAVIERTCS